MSEKIYRVQMNSKGMPNFATAVEVADRPQGEWMPIIEANEFGEAYQVGIYCSECGETLGCEANFCPNCGARLKGADDERVR